MRTPETERVSVGTLIKPHSQSEAKKRRAQNKPVRTRWAWKFVEDGKTRWKTFPQEVSSKREAESYRVKRIEELKKRLAEEEEEADPYPSTVGNVCDAYEAKVRSRSGAPITSVYEAEKALRGLREFAGDVQVVDFGPKALRGLRRRWVEQETPGRPRLTRDTVNRLVRRVKSIFGWAVSEELIPETTHRALMMVAGLREGEMDTRETDPVRPVPQSHIDAVRGRVSRQVCALIDLQLLTGARAGELVNLRLMDLDTGGRVWEADLAKHKTAHKKHKRIIFFGPAAQVILREFMADRPLDAYLFSPKEAEEERAAQSGGHRRPNQKPSPRKTTRTLGDCYSVSSYRRAITRACEEADVPAWTPHRLRHTAATRIRKGHDLETAQAVLGHATANTTQIYAEANLDRARKLAEKEG